MTEVDDAIERAEKDQAAWDSGQLAEVQNRYEIAHDRAVLAADVKRLQEALIKADSIMSLIAARGFTERKGSQDRLDLDAAIIAARACLPKPSWP